MPPKKDDRKGGEETLTRIAIVSEDKCVGELAQYIARLLLCQLGFHCRPRALGVAQVQAEEVPARMQEELPCGKSR